MKPQTPARQLLLPFLLVVGVATLAACAAMQHRSVQLQAALKFSHQRHAAEGVGCDDCHQGLSESGAISRGELIPAKETCKGCHEEAVTDKAKCGLCHLGDHRQARLTRADRKLSFSHKAHQARAKDGCKGCHPGADAATQPGVKLVPDMAACADRCHRKELTGQACTYCHEDLQRQRLAPVVKVGHQGDWTRRHGKLAQDASRCAACHDQTHCADCHARTAAMPLSIRFPERVEAGFIHRGDWLGRHDTEAEADPASCLKCHGATYCSSCHQHRGMSRSPDSTTAAARSPHGTEWMTPGAPGFHGGRARRDASRCASCHDQGAASNCVTCHKVGGSGGNPHPRGFDRRGSAGDCTANVMCLTCHSGGLGCR